MHSHQDAIESKLADTKVYLDKLQQEIGRTLEKIGSREKYINHQVHVHVCDSVHVHVCTCIQHGINKPSPFLLVSRVVT